MMSTPVALETAAGFDGVDHEAQAGAVGGHEGILVGAGAAGWWVVHLEVSGWLAGRGFWARGGGGGRRGRRGEGWVSGERG